jgi:hypothetical protein
MRAKRFVSIKAVTMTIIFLNSRGSVILEFRAREEEQWGGSIFGFNFREGAVFKMNPLV